MFPLFQRFIVSALFTLAIKGNVGDKMVIERFSGLFSNLSFLNRQGIKGFTKMKVGKHRLLSPIC